MPTGSPGSIRMICPNLKCRTLLSVSQAARGQTVQCRRCGMRVKVPGAGGAPAPARSEPASAPADEADSAADA